MKTATKSVGTGGHGASLEQVKQRFALWREGRKHGERISGALWAAAVDMAGQHGLQRTAQELRIDCERLKKRLDGGVGQVHADKAEPRFVEMFAPPAFSAAAITECIVEMENARGAKMRIEIKGGDPADLMRLSHAFWSSAS